MASPGRGKRQKLFAARPNLKEKIIALDATHSAPEIATILTGIGVVIPAATIRAYLMKWRKENERAGEDRVSETSGA